MKILTPFLLIALSIVLLTAYVGPLYDDMQTVQAQYAQYQDAITKAQKLQVKKSELQNRYFSFDKNQLERLEKIVPNKVDSVRLIVDINAIATKYGATINDVQTRTPPPVYQDGVIIPDTKPYDTLLLSFKITMSYENFLKFMRELESSLRVVDPSVISIVTSDKPGVNNYGVELKTYWLK